VPAIADAPAGFSCVRYMTIRSRANRAFQRQSEDLKPYLLPFFCKGEWDVNHTIDWVGAMLATRGRIAPCMGGG
jgi:hypothetical protein